MENLNLKLWGLVVIVVFAVIAALRYNRKESTKKIGQTASSIFSMLLSSLWLSLWVFAQWGIGKIFVEIPVDSVDQQFLDIFKYIFGIVTLIFVLIEVIKEIIVAYKSAKKEISKLKG
jgi:hypothetical protein